MNLLRSIVAGPRARHPEANLDLCYVTDKIIATSGPSVSYPSLAYRNPLDQLVRFLDSRHGEDWYIWEFRAEGCGYPDSEVHDRIWHFPWPDHHPPPFALVPKITASMRDWLHPVSDAAGAVAAGGDAGAASNGRVVVVHCKAGKGRSGTMAISYLITHEGWKKEDALQRFTERRMRPNFGNGISIPSQLRWIDYVERWAGHGGHVYVERAIEVQEVHVWGLRDGVKISVEGYVDAGKRIKKFHTFTLSEGDDGDAAADAGTPVSPSAGGKGLADVVQNLLATRQLVPPATKPAKSSSGAASPSTPTTASSIPTADGGGDDAGPPNTTNTVASGEHKVNTVFRPSSRIVLPTSDINLAAVRKTNWSALFSVAHVWFNCFFEGQGPERYAAMRRRQEAQQAQGHQTEPAEPEGAPWAESSGVFEISWDAMDGIKGSSRKGYKAFERVAVVWKAVDDDAPPHKTPPAAATISVQPPPIDTTASAGKPTRGRTTTGNSLVIPEPRPGEDISPVEAADWTRTVPVAAIDPDAAADAKSDAKLDPLRTTGMQGVPGLEIRDGPYEGKPSGDGLDAASADVQNGSSEGRSARGGLAKGGASGDEDDEGGGRESDSEDGAEGIRRGVLTD